MKITVLLCLSLLLSFSYKPNTNTNLAQREDEISALKDSVSKLNIELSRQKESFKKLKRELDDLKTSTYRDINRLKSLNQTQKMTLSQYLLSIFELKEELYLKNEENELLRLEISELKSK